MRVRLANASGEFVPRCDYQRSDAGFTIAGFTGTRLLRFGFGAEFAVSTGVKGLGRSSLGSS